MLSVLSMFWVLKRCFIFCSTIYGATVTSPLIAKLP